MNTDKMNTPMTTVRPAPYYPPPQVSAWGVIGGAIGSTFGWLFKTVAPAVVAGAAGGYAVHRYYESQDSEETTDNA